MRDRHDGSLEGGKVALQPLDRVQIQMVGRLVKQQNVGILQNEPPEIDARLFAAGKRIEKPRAHLRGNGKPVCDLVDGRLGIVAAESLELAG